MKSSSLMFAAVLTIGTAAAAQQHVVVPAFFPIAQTTDSTKGTDWSRIHAAGSAVEIVVADSSYLGLAGQGLTDARNQFTAERQVGQMVLGYVDSANGPTTGANPATILAEVDTWYSMYGGYIDGIFYDRGPEFTIGGPTDAQFQSFYVSLYQSTKTNHPSATVMLNAAGFPNDWIMTIPATDYATIWENSLNAYVNQYVAIGPGGTVPVPPWWSDPIYTSRGKLADIVYAATQLDITNVVNLSRNRGSRALYIFDRTSANYSGLACYFEQEVAAAQNLAVPAGAKTFCGTACTDITADNSNCGACGNACPAGQTCEAATCQPNFDCNSCACGCNSTGSACAAGARCIAKCAQLGGFCDPCLGCVMN